MQNPINSFELALKEARKALNEAYEERTLLEQRIVSLKQTIDGLASLCKPETDEDFVQVHGGKRPEGYYTSLTDAIRRIFSESEEPILTPPDLRNALVEMGVDMKKYNQPLVPIHNTLKRLEAQGEVVPFRDDNGDLRGYQWVSPLARAVAEVDPVQKLAKGVRFRSPGASRNIREWMALNGPVSKK
jgi:hypothetical protein